MIGKHQNGFVLVNALIIVAALSVVALGVLQDTSRTRAVVEVGRTSSQLDLMDDAAIAFVAELLRQDAGTSDFDHPSEPWALDGYPVEAGAGVVTVQVRDLQARFNLNLLAAAPDSAAPAVRRLTASLGLQDGLAERLIERSAPYASDSTDGGDDDAGETFQEGDLVTPAEIGPSTGFSSSDLSTLAPMFATLPRARLINANSANRDVLAATLDVEDGVASALVAMRNGRPFRELAEFENAVAALAPENQNAATLFGVRSEWFEVTTSAELDGVTRRNWAILHRDAETGRTRVFATGAPGP